jgi:predicted amidohydrolase YtcJ
MAGQGGHPLLPPYRRAHVAAGSAPHCADRCDARCEVDNSVIGPDQAITVEEALKAITIHAARQIGLEDTIGTLEPGKEANLTILEADPFKAEPNLISAIKVSETWVAGEKTVG